MALLLLAVVPVRPAAAPPAVFSIQGRVVGLSEGSAPAVSIELLGPGDEVLRTAPNPGGSFRVESVPAGIWRIDVSLPDGRMYGRPVPVLFPVVLPPLDPADPGGWTRVGEVVAVC